MKKPQQERFTFCPGSPSCEKTAKWEPILSFTFLAAVFLCSGCGIVSVMGTPSQYEKKIPAEFNLARHKGRKILVLVNQPRGLEPQINLRYYLTEAINKTLVKKVKVRPKYLVAYNELAEFRSNQPDFSSLSPAKIGKALGADLVLFVMLEDCQLNEIAETDYYKGFLSTQTLLIDTAAGEKLWPKAADSKTVRVGFEAEKGGREAAVRRLASACAYCTARYLYNCPKTKFNLPDDRSGIAWESWKK